MMYGCKIMVSLTLCRFLDHPVCVANDFLVQVIARDGEYLQSKMLMMC